MNKPVVLCDMDSVLNDLGERWLDSYNRTYNDMVPFTQITNWDWTVCGLKEDCGPKIYDLLTDELITSCIPRAGAQLAIQQLQEWTRVVVVTSSYRERMPTRRKWLERYFPTVDDIVCAKVKDCVRGDIRIDDYHGNLIGLSKLEILFDRPYNQNQAPHAVRVFGKNEWADAVNAIERTFLAVEFA